MKHRKAQLDMKSIERNLDEECSKKIQFYSKKITTLKKISAQSFTKIKQSHSSLQGIQNGREVQLLYKRYRQISKIFAKTIFLVVFINFLYFQQQTNLIVSSINDKSHKITEQQKQFVEQKATQLIWFGFVLSIFSCVFSVLRFQSQKLLYSTQKIKFLHRIYMILQIFLIMMQPFPGLNSTYCEMSIIRSGNQFVSIKINHFMCILALFKLFFLFRQGLQENYVQFLQVNSGKFFKPSYNRICKIYSCQKDYIHIMKCIFKEHFILFIALVYSLLLFLGAYVLRIAQINYDGRFFYFQNAFWLTLMSMTTIGFGDIVPHTSFGVVIDGFSAYAGVIIVSLLVASLTDLFTMSYRERRSLLILKRLNMKKDLKQVAANYINKCVYRLYRQKKLDKKLKQSLQQKQFQMQFHQKRMDLKNNKEGSLNLVKQMYDQFQAVRLRLDQLVSIEDNLMNSLSDKERFALQTVRSNKLLRKNSLQEQKQQKQQKEQTFINVQQIQQ